MTTSNLHTGIHNQTLQYDTILAAYEMPVVVNLTKSLVTERKKPYLY